MTDEYPGAKKSKGISQKISVGRKKIKNKMNISTLTTETRQLAVEKSEQKNWGQLLRPDV